jgi:hypothetical protein
MTLEAARQQYLRVWNQTEFSVPFNTYVEPGSVTGYGIYKEHSGNIFKQGEAIQLYVEPVAFGHKQILRQDGMTLYLINLTADVVIDTNGNEVASIKGISLGSIISHRQNTELHALLTLTQETPFPVGNYIVTYIVHDQISGESFQIIKRITIADNNASITGVQETESS